MGAVFRLSPGRLRFPPPLIKEKFPMLNAANEARRLEGHPIVAAAATAEQSPPPRDPAYSHTG